MNKGARVLIKTKGKDEWITKATIIKEEDEFGLIKVITESGVILKNFKESIKLDS